MSRRGENIRKRKDGRWEGRYKSGIDKNGKNRYMSVYGKTYSEVKEKLRLKIISAKNDDEITRCNDITLSVLISIWEQKNEIRLKKATKTKYSYIINAHILPELGDLMLSSITIAQLEGFLNTKLCSGRLDGSGMLSPSYVRTIGLILTSVLDLAVAEGLCRPFKTKINKPIVSRSKVDILSPDQQMKLERYTTNNLTPTSIGILISLYTGLRVGEVCALSWNDIDLNSETLYVRHTVSRVKAAEDASTKTSLILDSPKTPSSLREIPIPSPLADPLKRYRALSTSEYLASERETFVSPRTYESRYHKVLIECDIEPIRYHALRHTFATRCIEAGVDVKTLSEILGHSKTSMTLDTYVHTTMKQKRNELEKLSPFANG